MAGKNRQSCPDPKKASSFFPAATTPRATEEQSGWRRGDLGNANFSLEGEQTAAAPDALTDPVVPTDCDLEKSEVGGQSGRLWSLLCSDGPPELRCPGPTSHLRGSAVAGAVQQDLGHACYSTFST